MINSCKLVAATQIYRRRESVIFFRLKDEFGGLSNMAARFPLQVNGVAINSSEALYQACRFSHRPDLQSEIIAQPTPMSAKAASRLHLAETRTDWTEVRIDAMRWCLRVKLAQHFAVFSQLLLETGAFPIVEQSRYDAFWGAIEDGPDFLAGTNMLGQVLMELRTMLREHGDGLQTVLPPTIPAFILCGIRIETI
jgi:ribA/ribD-fused uncharacterized protein